MRLLFTTLGVLFCLPIIGQAPDESSMVRLALERCGATDFIFEIPAARMESLPRWHPESPDPPPISQRRAIGLGREQFQRKYPRVDRFEVIRISLAEAGSESDRTHGTWFYQIQYRGWRDGKKVGSCGMVGVILLDGTVVEARLERKSP